jgi:hypothetical protein
MVPAAHGPCAMGKQNPCAAGSVFPSSVRWLHIQLWPIAPLFLINSSLYVVLRLLSVHHGAPNGITDILLGVHCINVMRELEILKLRELP